MGSLCGLLARNPIARFFTTGFCEGAPAQKKAQTLFTQKQSEI
jgi:hypothetical protein